MATAYPACRVAAAHVAPVFLDAAKTVDNRRRLRPIAFADDAAPPDGGDAPPDSPPPA